MTVQPSALRLYCDQVKRGEDNYGHTVIVDPDDDGVPESQPCPAPKCKETVLLRPMQQVEKPKPKKKTRSKKKG